MRSLSSAHLHLSQYEWQGEGLGSQVTDGALRWSWETGHTHSCHIKSGFSVFKQATGEPTWGGGKWGTNRRNYVFLLLILESDKVTHSKYKEVRVFFLMFWQAKMETECDTGHKEAEQQHDMKQNRRVGPSKHPLLCHTAPHHSELRRELLENS